MRSSSWSFGAFAAGIFATTLLVYGPALQGDFVWDDDFNVTANDALRTLGGLARIWLDRTSTQQWYPLTHTSFWIDYHLWGLSPLGYHVENVLLHAASAVLFALVLRRLGIPGAFLAAAVFALHPVHVESVAWITERKNVLSGALYLAAAWVWLGEARGRRLLAVALFAAALLAKSATATLPLALAAVGLWKRGRLERAETVWLGAMLFLGAAAGLHTRWIELHAVGAEGTEFTLSLAERAIVAGRAIWFYLGKLAWPAGLAFSYPRWSLDVHAVSSYAFPLGAAGLLAALWLARGRLGSGPLLASSYFVLTLAPALGLFNVFYMRYAFVADHFQYLASLGPIALAAATAVRLPLQRRVSGVLCAGLLAVLGALSWHQAGAYRDEETLWRRSIAAAPDSFMAHYNLAERIARRGAIEEALAHYREAIRLNPRWTDARVNLAVLLAEQGHLNEAIAELRSAVELQPAHAMARFNLGLALEMSGEQEGALEEYRAAVAAQPDLVVAHHNLALLLFARGEYEEAWEAASLERAYGGTPAPEMVRALVERLRAPAPG